MTNTPPSPGAHGAAGNWYREETGDALLPHLDAGPPLGPHYDYVAPDGSEYRLFPGDRRVPKGRPGATAPLEVVDLGAVGQARLRQALSSGNALSALVNARPETGQGRVTAAVPAGTTADRAARLDDGGLLDQWAGWQHAATAIAEHAAGRHGDDLILVAEHANPHAADPDLRALPGGRRFVHGTHAYEWTARLDDTRHVQGCLRRANSPWLLNAFVTVAPPPRSVVDDDGLARMATGVQRILFRIHDGEGFATWTPLT